MYAQGHCVKCACVGRGVCGRELCPWALYMQDIRIRPVHDDPGNVAERLQRPSVCPYTGSVSSGLPIPRITKII